MTSRPTAGPVILGWSLSAGSSDTRRHDRPSLRRKSIDVALAVDFVRLACEGANDVGVLTSASCSAGTRTSCPRWRPSAALVLMWRSRAGRARADSASPTHSFCHYLDADDYEACRDYTDYTAI